MQAHFTTVFQSLFGGGHAKLELTDDDYLSAVDIIVQPPGKKLQHLSLLSGGERIKCYCTTICYLESKICLY